MSSRKALSERDICTKFIAPALAEAGWDIQTQVREEVAFTVGRAITKSRVRTDLLLLYQKVDLAPPAGIHPSRRCPGG